MYTTVIWILHKTLLDREKKTILRNITIVKNYCFICFLSQKKKSYLIYEVKKRAKFFPSIYNWFKMPLKVNWTLNSATSTIYKDGPEHYSNLTKILIALATEY